MNGSDRCAASSHAVVIGTGMAGLLAAAVLSGSGRTVTVVERDTVAGNAEPRNGVPQGRQPQVLLHRGLCEIEQLLPGLRDQLLAAGGVPLDTGNLAWLGERGWAPFGTPAFELVSATRPLVEHLVRGRVSALPGVELLDGVRVRGLARSATGTRWVVECDDAPQIVTDLVVDASGRSSRMPQWLAALGFGTVSATTVDARFGYAGRFYLAPPDQLGRAAGIVMLPTPHDPTGGVALPVEGGRWLIAAVGAGTHRPPRDPDGFTRFLARLRDPAIADFATTAQPLDDVAVHRRTSNVRRHYERLNHWPDGLLVLGDSLCAFNPVYGQGITVAATQALLLRNALTSGTRPGWERRLLRQLVRATEVPWAIATGEDLCHTEADRRRPMLERLFSQWSGEVDRLAAHGNVRAQRALDRVYHLVDPPTRLLDPALLGSVVRGRLLGLPAPSPRPPLAGDTSTRPSEAR